MCATDDHGFHIRGLRRGAPLLDTACVEVHRLCSADAMECMYEVVLKDNGCEQLHPDDDSCPDLAKAEALLGADVEQIDDDVFDPVSGHTTVTYLDLGPLLARL